MIIAVYGLGKLGLPLASVLAQAGFRVIGIDASAERVNECRTLRAHSLSSGWMNPEEPGMRLDGDLEFTDLPHHADISFVVVPTPSNADGSFCSVYVESALSDICEANAASEGEFIAVVVSTVSPGTCDRLVKERRNKLMQLVYNPTFIALGSVVEDLVQPNMLLLGGTSQSACKRIDDVWTQIFHNVGELERFPKLFNHGSYLEIELLKLSLNAILGTKIALANSLGALYKAYGVDPEYLSLLTYDPRVGSGYLMPGGPISGPCLPRDNKALQAAAKTAPAEVRLLISEATDQIDYNLRRQIFYDILKPMPKQVGILGMSYKYGVGVTEGSMGSWLVEELGFVDGVRTFTYDDRVRGVDEYMQVLSCDVIVVTQVEYEKLLSYPRNEKARVIRSWR